MPDGVKLKGTWLQRGHPKVIILLNAAMRSRHQFGMVLFSEWLALEFDILAFDARGHFESEGHWQGGGILIEDVKELILFAKSQGYEKVGICGRSAGGWVSVMTAARYGLPDSIVSISPPLDSLSLRPSLRPLAHIATSRLGLLFRVLAQITYHVKIGAIDHTLALRSEIAKVSPIPLLLVFNEEDPVLGIGATEAQAVYDLARNPKKLVIIRSKGHGMELSSFRQIALEVDNWFCETLL